MFLSFFIDFLMFYRKFLERTIRGVIVFYQTRYIFLCMYVLVSVYVFRVSYPLAISYSPSPFPERRRGECIQCYKWGS